MKKLNKHFTLTELVIVVAIIAVIAIIFVPGILAARRNSNEKACIGFLRFFDAVILQRENRKIPQAGGLRYSEEIFKFTAFGDTPNGARLSFFVGNQTVSVW